MNKAREIARPYILRINKNVEEFIALVLTHFSAEQKQNCDVWELMPEGFSIRSDGWQKMERKIENAIADNQVTLAESLCQEYEARANKYLADWREKLTVEWNLPERPKAQHIEIGMDKNV